MKKFVFYNGLINDDIETLTLTPTNAYKDGNLIVAATAGLVTALPIIASGESVFTAAMPFGLTTALVYLTANITVEQIRKKNIAASRAKIKKFIEEANARSMFPREITEDDLLNNSILDRGDFFVTGDSFKTRAETEGIIYLYLDGTDQEPVIISQTVVKKRLASKIINSKVVKIIDEADLSPFFKVAQPNEFDAQERLARVRS